MAQYIMQEMNLPNEEGKRLLYPRMVLAKRVGLQEVAEALERSSTYTTSDVIGVLQGVARELAWLMAQGHPVKLDGIGTFTPALTLRKGKERETDEGKGTRRNAQSLQVGKIHFKPEKELLRETERRCHLERSQQSYTRSSTVYTLEQRLARAQEFLETHPYLTVRDYMSLTGLKRTSATTELKRLAGTEGSGLAISGFGKHRVYVRKRD